MYIENKGLEAKKDASLLQRFLCFRFCGGRDLSKMQSLSVFSGFFCLNFVVFLKRLSIFADGIAAVPHMQEP
jgi:hypothetical protein